MSEKNVYFTIVIQVICGSVIAWLLAAGNGQTAQAAPLYQVATPEPFLGPIYYGQEAIWQVFDHEFPFFGVDTENNWVVHYDGAQYRPPIPAGYGYNGHIGIDYGLVYEPVLAAATGTVHYAGWSNPANHRAGYGLHVQMNHTANADYRTWYGHFSVLVVETGDAITAPYDDRQRILGIGGNTGYVFNSSGVCDDVGVDPLCGAHLHFEVQQISVNRPVNPYGWIGSVNIPDDPWAEYENPPGTPAGATSYNLWVDRPATGSPQYPGGNPIYEPSTSGGGYIRDDSDSQNYSTNPPGCMFPGSGSGVNNDFDYTLTIPTYIQSEYCGSKWMAWGIGPDEYDVYVNIPSTAPEPASLGAIYTIVHDGSGRIKVSWDGFSDELDYFVVYRNTSADTGSWELVYWDEAVSGQWVDTNVGDGVLYYYWLDVLDCYGGEELLGPKSTTTGGPPPPTNLSATYYNFPRGSVSLSWAPVTAPSGTTFNVYRHSASPVPRDAAHRIASGLTTAIFTDMNGPLGDYYVVTAVNSYGESGPSNTAQAFCPGCG